MVDLCCFGLPNLTQPRPSLGPRETTQPGPGTTQDRCVRRPFRAKARAVARATWCLGIGEGG